MIYRVLSTLLAIGVLAWGAYRLGYAAGLGDTRVEVVPYSVCDPNGPVRYVEWCPAWAVTPCPEEAE